MSEVKIKLNAFTAKDAAALFKLANDEEIASWCGWKPHKSKEDSLKIIKTVLSVKECYAIRANNKLVGAIQLKLKGQSNIINSDYGGELGFWVGREYHNKGYCFEAMKQILKHAFFDLKLETIYCGYYEGNIPCKNLQEKFGFKFYKVFEQILVKPINERRDCNVSIMHKEDYVKLYGNH